MDGLSAAASIIAVIDISAKVGALCFQYSVAVKDAKRDIKRLQRRVNRIQNVLKDLQKLLDGQDKKKLSATRRLLGSLEECYEQLQELMDKLEPSRGRRTMQRFGLQALTWPFNSKQVEKMVSSLEQYEHTFSLALQVDHAGLILGVDQKLNLVDKKTDAVLSKIDLAKLPTASGASFDSHMEEHNSTCLPNTRTQLLNHIQDWAIDKHGKPIFWLNGAAGTGKSTIARTIARTFADQGQLGASFFFKRGEGERGNATRFFATIATQLAVRVEGISTKIREAVDTDPAISTKALKDQFEKLILEPLLEVSGRSRSMLVIVIDALDECEQDRDIQEILRLLARTKDLKTVSLRIFVTSRPEFHIRFGFKQMHNGTYEDLVLHNAARQTVEHDIRIYFEHEFTNIREARSLPSKWPGKRNIQALVKMAVPSFIFAATVCRFVGEISGNPRKRLDDILQYESEDVSKLDITYLPILRSLFSTQDKREREKLSIEFQDIVGSIVTLESPLSITSLARLIGKTEDDISFRLDSLHSVLVIPNSKDVPVRLLHLSFREFLHDPSKKGKSPFWVDKRKRHARLASQCIELMTGPNGLRRDMCNLVNPGTLRSQLQDRAIDENLPAELQYACCYWVHHLHQSQSHIDDGDTTDLFLQKHFLHWLEAMSLIGEINKCNPSIETLYGLTSRSSNFSSRFLQDAGRFTLRFRYIAEEAPLQIYYSALMFVPEMSVIRKAFINEAALNIKMLSKKEYNWDACRSVLEGHAWEVNAVAFSPDGHLIASASADNKVRMWEVRTGSCRSVFEGHTRDVIAVAFSPDGQLVASASKDKTIRLWEAETGSCRSVLEGHVLEISAIAFSPDGQLVASAAKDESVRIWEVAIGSCRIVVEGHISEVTAVAFSPDGRQVASASYDKTVRVWEADTGSPVSVFKGHTGGISAFAFSPDGQLIASGSYDDTVQVWEVATASCCSVLEGHIDSVSVVAFSPDGKLVASASKDKTVRVWEVATGSCRSVLEGHIQWINAVTFSPDGHLVASASDDKTVRVWEVMSGSCRSVLEGHTREIHTVTFSPDGQLVSSASSDKTVRVWETSAVVSPDAHQVTSASSRVVIVTFSPDGQLVASVSGDDKVRVWGVATGECHGVFDGRKIAFSPDGQLVVSISWDKMVRVWETATGSCRSVLDGHTRYINTVAFSPDGKLVASGSDDSTARVWEVATGSRRSVFKDHTDRISAIVFSPNGQLIASASEDRTVRVWEAVTGSCCIVLEGHTREITVVTFSPDGQLVASASFDRTVHIWEISTGSCCSVLKGHIWSVDSVTFSADGELIASASSEAVRLWKTRNGSCIQVFQRYTNITDLAFSSDGQYLHTSKGDIHIPSHSIGTLSLREKQQFSVFVEDQWIQLDGQRLLWLPLEYRPTWSAVKKDVICLGHLSGRITLLKVSMK